MKFELDTEQIKLLENWLSKIKNTYGKVGTLKYTFIPTGIGNIVTVETDIQTKTGKKIKALDLSMIENW